jgi:thiamine-monophosphate kinase
MGEFELIDKLKKTLASPSKRVLVGIGDDTLVANPPKDKLLWTVDCLVENVHFDFNYSTPEEVGWKALAVNVSDIAAMGGKSLYALVSLAIPKRISESKIVEIYKGMKACAAWAEVDVVGGNISRSPQDFFIDVTVVGEASKPILRSGAKEGQAVAITGFPGLSASGLWALKQLGRRAVKKYPLSTEAHLRPAPRLKWASQLASLGVSSLIDISDGLSSELHHLAQESSVGFEIEEKLLPLNSEVKNLAQTLDKSPLDLMLNGGEDYELLMTFPFSKLIELSLSAQAASIPFTMIGHTVSPSKKVKLRNRAGKLKPISPKGWTHF